MGLNHCCCCIPLRVGVLLIASLSSIVYILWLVGLLIKRDDFLGYDNTMLSSTAPGYWTAVGVIALYAVSSLFGVIGSITQNRKMIGVFKILYWLVTILLLIVTFALWILCLVKRDLLVESCAEVARELASSSSSYYTPVQLPNGGDNLTQSCATAAKQLLIVGGLIVFVGNLFQVYFASVISAYAARLKRNNQHQKLRDLDDYPEITANKMAVY